MALEFFVRNLLGLVDTYAVRVGKALSKLPVQQEA